MLFSLARRVRLSSLYKFSIPIAGYTWLASFGVYLMWRWSFRYRIESGDLFYEHLFDIALVTALVISVILLTTFLFVTITFHIGAKRLDISTLDKINFNFDRCGYCNNFKFSGCKLGIGDDFFDGYCKNFDLNKVRMLKEYDTLLEKHNYIVKNQKMLDRSKKIAFDNDYVVKKPSRKD